jgi:hypothetical protein
MEKILIGKDDKQIQNNIEEAKKLVININQLKTEYSRLHLQPFSNYIWMRIMKEDLKFLEVELQIKIRSFAENAGLPEGITLGYNADIQKLERLKSVIWDGLSDAELSLDQVDFDYQGQAVLTDVMKELIAAKYTYYITNQSEKRLYDLIVAHCTAVNNLDIYIRKHGFPSILEGLSNLNELYYAEPVNDGDGLKMVPNQEMFDVLERLKRARNRG